MIWPDNKRIALMVAFDIDAETMWFRRGMNMPHGIDCTKHMVAMSCGLYSTKQALPRIMKMLDDEDIKATFFTPAYIAELHPDTIKALADAGHEIAYHGYQHEVYGTYEKQDANMTKSERILEEITGKKPVGDRAPNGKLYDYSDRLWLEHGYIYSSNWRDCDGPCLHSIDGKDIPVVELPKDSIFDDTAYDMYTILPPAHNELINGRTMTKIWRDEFDALADEGRMLNLVMHPQYIGRPAFLRALREFIQYAKANGAWIATNEEVARYVLDNRELLNK